MGRGEVWTRDEDGIGRERGRGSGSGSGNGSQSLMGGWLAGMASETGRILVTQSSPRAMSLGVLD